MLWNIIGIEEKYYENKSEKGTGMVRYHKKREFQRFKIDLGSISLL